MNNKIVMTTTTITTETAAAEVERKRGTERGKRVEKDEISIVERTV